MSEMAAIQARNKARTQGNWRWFGFTSTQHIYLATQEFGRKTVMTFGRWGMRSAQPLFQVEGRLCDVKELVGKGLLLCDHSAEIRGGSHPDMIFIQHAPEDVTWLLARLARIDLYAGQRCENNQPECGPVEYADSDDIPLCAVCWSGLCRDATDLPGDNNG